MTEIKSGINNVVRDLRYPVRVAKWVVILWISVIGISNSASSFAQTKQPQPQPAQSQQAPVASVQEISTPSTQEMPNSPRSGGISGTVVDPDGAVIANVKVTLTRTGGTSTEVSSKTEARSDDQGDFIFTNVAPGPFQLSVTASGFAPLERSGVLQAGESLVIPQIALAVAHNRVDVEVTLSQEQVAEDEIKVEETQRLLGVFPNFYVSYVPDAAPLTTKLKFQLAWKATADPVSFVVTGAVAGLEQAEDTFSGYGQGMQGYAKRYGAAYANQVAGTFIGGAILPSLFKQDPRYFVKGSGSTKSRFFYAVASAVMCRGDNGRRQLNYSYILGDLASGGISNLYYPAQNRNGAALTFENGLVGIGAGALGNVLQEFFLRKITHHAAPDSAKP